MAEYIFPIDFSTWEISTNETIDHILSKYEHKYVAYCNKRQRKNLASGEYNWREQCYVTHLQINMDEEDHALMVLSDEIEILWDNFNEMNSHVDAFNFTGQDLRIDDRLLTLKEVKKYYRDVAPKKKKKKKWKFIDVERVDPNE